MNEKEVIEQLRTSQDRLTDGITGFAGSMRFVYLHAAWFGAWILVNTGRSFSPQLGLDPHEVERRVQEIVRASNQQISAPIGSATKDVFDPDSV